jgi:hypothetical protein
MEAKRSSRFFSQLLPVFLMVLKKEASFLLTASMKEGGESDEGRKRI